MRRVKVTPASYTRGLPDAEQGTKATPHHEADLRDRAGTVRHHDRGAGAITPLRAAETHRGTPPPGTSDRGESF